MKVLQGGLDCDDDEDCVDVHGILVWCCLIVSWTDRADVVDDATFAYTRKIYMCCIGSAHVLHRLVLVCAAGRR